MVKMLRFLKQFIYGLLFLSFWALIAGGIYLLFLRTTASCFDNLQNQNETGIDCGGSCQSCEIKTLSPIQVNWVKYFPTGDKIAVAAEIKNSNANYGADGFSYTLDIYGKNGGKIKSLTRKSFIYAAEIKYIVEPLEINPRDVSDIRISIADVGWKSKSEFERPKIQIREAKTAMAEDKIKRGAVPHHSFHVLNIWGQEGHNDSLGILNRMDECRISSGTVTEVNGHEIKVSTEPLIYENGKFTLGPVISKVLTRQLEAEYDIEQIKSGQLVSIHWSVPCEVITPTQAANLRRYTLKNIAFANLII